MLVSKEETLVTEMSEEDWDAVIDVNLKGAFLCCKEVGKILVNNGRGRLSTLLPSRDRWLNLTGGICS